MTPRTYIETSVVSYLTARPTRDLIMTAHQQVTAEWWEARRSMYSLVSSQLVVDEASTGDADAAGHRLDALRGIPLIEITPDALQLGGRLVSEGGLPKKATADAVHIAVAAFGGCRYLLTWNFRHMLNAAFRDKIETICRRAGLEPPIICTPQQLLED